MCACLFTFLITSQGVNGDTMIESPNPRCENGEFKTPSSSPGVGIYSTTVWDSSDLTDHSPTAGKITCLLGLTEQLRDQ